MTSRLGLEQKVDEWQICMASKREPDLGGLDESQKMAAVVIIQKRLDTLRLFLDRMPQSASLDDRKIFDLLVEYNSAANALNGLLIRLDPKIAENFVNRIVDIINGNG